MPRRKKAKPKKKMDDNSEGTSVDIEPVKKESEPVDKEIEIDKEEAGTEVELKIVEDSDLVEHGENNDKKVDKINNNGNGPVEDGNGCENEHNQSEAEKNIENAESDKDLTNEKEKKESNENGDVETTQTPITDNADNMGKQDQRNCNIDKDEDTTTETFVKTENIETSSNNQDTNTEQPCQKVDTLVAVDREEQDCKEKSDNNDQKPEHSECDRNSAKSDHEPNTDADVDRTTMSKTADSEIILSQNEEHQEQVVENSSGKDEAKSESENSKDSEMLPEGSGSDSSKSDIGSSVDVDSFISSVCEEISKEMKDVEKELTIVEESDSTHVTNAENKQTIVDKGIEKERTNVEKGPYVTSEPKDLENDGVECLPSDKDAEFKQESASVCDTDKGDKGDTKVTDNANEGKVDTAESDKDKQIEKLTNENMVLQEELKQAHATIHTSQKHIHEQQIRHNQMMMSVKLQLYKSQAALKQQQNKSETQMSEVMSHLLLLEGRLKREQCRVKRELKHKNETIESQKLEILKLREQNDQLLNAIKEFCAKGGMNGYMRDKKKGLSSSDNSDGGKSGKDKKVSNGKLNTVKDKFSWKNRSSLELNTFDPEKYLIKNARMYSSHEELNKVGHSNEGRPRSNVEGGSSRSTLRSSDYDPRERQFGSPGSNGDFKRSPRNSQNYFSDNSSPKQDLCTSTSESSQLSEHSSTSGFHSLSDHDLSNPDLSGNNGNPFEDDDDDENCYFSFSSTRINTVIDEEEAIGQSGQMLSMGSMPLLASFHGDKKHLSSNKDRPHSLSSVDLLSIQQQAQNLSNLHMANVQNEVSTPPSSPSFTQKTELTPFQTFKTMFKRKGSKNKGKKRSVSLSQTTTKEYTEAMKKHFQKYDMN